MRLLVVEDEQDIRTGLELAFQESGYAVDTADDGVQALFKATQWDYDAIVLDIMLPGMSGWDVLEQLRKKKTTPVILLTARDEIRDRIKGLDLGSDDYLVKPFHLEELTARVRAIIRRHAGLASSVLTAGPISIDTGRRTVTRAGQKIELTAKEFAVIEILMMHRGTIVTRTLLYNHLFDENDESLSNLLDVHICNLRKKLGKNFIKTRRGHGYIIEREQTCD